MFSFNKLLGSCCIFSYCLIRLEYIKQPNTGYASALNIGTQFTNSFRCLQASLVLSMWGRQKMLLLGLTWQSIVSNAE